MSQKSVKIIRDTIAKGGLSPYSGSGKRIYKAMKKEMSSKKGVKVPRRSSS